MRQRIFTPGRGSRSRGRSVVGGGIIPRGPGGGGGVEMNVTSDPGGDDKNSITLALGGGGSIHGPAVSG